MQPHSWTQLKAIFDEARLRKGNDRAEYLNHACGDDAELRDEVDGLLEAYDEADDFLSDGTDDAEEDAANQDSGRPADEPTRKIGRYRLLDRLGEGGFGTVYRAEQTEPVRRQVALKLIRAGVDSQRVVARFEAERQALAMMEHPNIARVIDGGTTETNAPFFVMELIIGSPITEYCDRMRLSLSKRLGLFLDVCGAVQHAHQRGIIHRDLKPSNVLVAVGDGSATPKVIDFGVAKAVQAPISDSTLTTQQQIIGTPAYMSPEQAAGSPEGVDTRTDVYSLGVLLYELLTGVTPFDTGTLMNAGVGEMIRIIQQVEPARPSTRISRLRDDASGGANLPPRAALRGDGSSILSADAIADVRSTDTSTLRRRLSGDLDWIVMKCLEKDADRRYPTAAALADDLRRHLQDEPVTARPPSRAYRLRKFARRNRGVVVVSSLLAIAMVAGTVISTIAFVRADRARVRAEDAEQSANSVTAYLRDMLGAVSPEDLGRDATLRDMLDKQDAELSRKFADQPLIEATLRLTIGNTYSALGHFEEGEPHLRRAVELRKANLGPDHEDTAEAMQRLAANLRARSLYDEAEPLLREAVAIQERTVGTDAVETLTSRYELATLLRVMQRYDEAETVSRDVLDTCRSELGPSNKLTLEARQNLAAVYNSTGRRGEARSLTEETIRLQTETLGPDHPDTLLSRFDLAIGPCGSGHHEAAAAMYPDLITAHERTLGDQHRMTLAVRSYYARELAHVGRLEEADTLISEILPMQRAMLGEAHRDVLETIDFAAGIKGALGQTAAELKLRDSLVELYEKYRGPEDRSTLSAMTNLAAALVQTGDVKRAEALHIKALAGYRNVVGPAADDTVNSTVHLVNLLHSQRRYDEEAELIDKALSDLRAERPEMDGGVQELLHRRGHLLQATNRMDEALDAFRSTYDAQVSTIHDPVQIDHYASCLSNALVGAKKFDEALDVYDQWIARVREQHSEATIELAGLLDRVAYCLLESGAVSDGEARAREAAAIREKLTPDDEMGIAGSQMLISTSLTRQKRYAEATPILREVLRIRERVFGPDHWLVHNTQSQLGECFWEQGMFDEARGLIEAGYEGMRSNPGAPPARVTEAAARWERVRTNQAPVP